MVWFLLSKNNSILTKAAVLNHLRGTEATGDLVVDVAKIVPVIENSMDGTVSTLSPVWSLYAGEESFR